MQSKDNIEHLRRLANRLIEFGMITLDRDISDDDDFCAWMESIDFERKYLYLGLLRMEGGAYEGVSQAMMQAIGQEMVRSEVNKVPFDSVSISASLFAKEHVFSIEDISYLMMQTIMQDKSSTLAERANASFTSLTHSSAARDARIAAETNEINLANLAKIEEATTVAKEQLAATLRANELLDEQISLEREQLQQAKEELAHAENALVEAESGRKADESVATETKSLANETKSLASQTKLLAIFTLAMAIATVGVLLVTLVREPTVEVEVEVRPEVVEAVDSPQ